MRELTREDVLAMEPNGALDELIGLHVTKVNARTHYSIMDRDEKGTFITFSSKDAAEDHLKENLEEHPDGLLAKEGAHVVRWHSYPRYSQEISAAMEIESRIKGMEWHIQHNYLIALHKITGLYGEINLKDIFSMMQASPSNRCKAALLAVLEATP